MRQGDIIFVKGTGPISRMIRFFTKSQYSHVALVVSENHVIEIDMQYSLQVRPIEYKSYDVYRLNRELTNSEVITMLSYAYSLIGSQYDFGKIISLAIEILFHERGKKLFDNPRKFICSDIIDCAYKQIGIDLVPQFNNQDTTPDDISKSKSIVMVESFN